MRLLRIGIARSLVLLLVLPLLPVHPASLAEDAPSFSPLPTEPEAVTVPARSLVDISLPALIELVVIGNRELRDRQLERLTQRQVLRAAEARFDPRWTPAVGIGLAQRFDGGFFSTSRLSGSFGRTSTDLGDRTTLTQSAGVLGEVTTRQGTAVRLTLDALGNAPVNLQITQPLLRDAGTTVNEAPVQIARLAESQNVLALQQTLIVTVTDTVTQYTSLIQAQESVGIQQQALARRQQRLVILEALVAAGRRAEVELVNARRSVADAERDLLLAQTRLEQANTALLNLVGTDRPLLFVAATETITDLLTTFAARVDTFDLETLVAIAYERRPDYRQTAIEQEVAQLNRVLAENDRRWQLNLEGDARLGDFSETSVGLVARRTFEDPDLETARIRSEVNLVQQQNRLVQQQIEIRNEITNQLNTVQANLARVEAARRATENARLQLEVTQELFNRGRSSGGIFQIITQEEDLVQAQNQQLVAEIEFLNSIVNLDRAVGLTLETWSQEVDFRPALLTPSALTDFTAEPPLPEPATGESRP